MNVTRPEQTGTALRFLLVGGINFLLSWSLLWFFTAVLGWPYLVSTAVAFVIGTLFGHNRNRIFTFRATDQSYARQLLKYTATTLAGLGFSLLLMWLLVELAGIHYLIANLFVAAIQALWNFWISSTWVFARRRAAASARERDFKA